MMLDYRAFRATVFERLHTLDVEKAAQFSSVNHHVNGMNYLCLQRDEEGETLKLYIIEKPSNPNSGFLVNPHTHRYSFSSYVLAGRVKHIRFRERDSGIGLVHQRDWVKCMYSPESISVLHQTYLRPHVTEYHEKGDKYFVSDSEIHTLQMYDDSQPVLLGLVQKPDTRKTSRLFLPANEWPNMNRPNTVKCMPHMVEHMRECALSLLGKS